MRAIGYIACRVFYFACVRTEFDTSAHAARFHVLTIQLERVKGIEPSYSAWKAAALPLSYTRACAIN
jgi:hypothetical protein